MARRKNKLHARDYDLEHEKVEVAKRKRRELKRERKQKTQPAALLPVTGDLPFAPAEIALLEKVVGQDWDLILVGDGSAKDRTGVCAWAVTLFDRHNNSKRICYGGASVGDCLLGELLPYVQALTWYSRFRGLRRLRERPAGEQLRVAILTDSQVTATHGNELATAIQDARRMKSTRPFWGVLLQMAENGYCFDWHWVKRNKIMANRQMNLLAQQVRRRLEQAG